MHLDVILIAAGAFLGASAGILYFFYDARSFATRMFALGMIVLAAEQGLSWFCIHSATAADVVEWENRRLFVTSLLPGIWLFFGLSFGRENYGEFVHKWKWMVFPVLIIPLALVLIPGDSLFAGAVMLPETSSWVLHFGWRLYTFQIVFLLCAVLIIANLERTIRASCGASRWHIKIIVLGIGTLFAFRIYSSSQALLFSSLNPTLLRINAAALLAADLLLIVGLARARLKSRKIYVSQQFMSSSITVMIVGIYLLAVGVMAKAAQYLGAGESLLQNAFFVFLALLGATLLFLSDAMRYEIKRFVSRHFHLPHYDYRKVWGDFGKRTVSLGDTKDLCMAVAKLASETFAVSSVSIWLLDDTRQQARLSGSTALGLSPDEELKRIEKEIAFLMLTMRDRTMPVDLDRSEWAHPQRDESVLRYRSTNLIRYCVSLFAGMEFLGVITLNDRMTGEPLSIEDFDLLKSIADQSAGILQNRRLFERLGQAKEMEAFQTLSAFFVHDLKNLASTLSLTLQNFPVHYDNPEFREDALRVMSQSVERINTMCARLSMVNQKLELNRTEGDINRLVSETLAGLIQTFKSPPVCELQGVPGVSMDPEQMKKVLTNLVLNASEAIENGGEIRIETCEDNGCVVLSVSDTGCGMSREFVSRSLFHPFKSTKKRGLGIGLYHSKMIVEAHQGRIEVESREGKGSTFRVVMPAGRK